MRLPSSRAWRGVPHPAAQHHHPSAVCRETLHASPGTLVETFPGDESPRGVREPAFPKPPLMLLVHGPRGRDTVSTKHHALSVRTPGLGTVEPLSSCVSAVGPRFPS